ncbi:hypothetical protein KYK30_14360 [Shinella yambaruensis]|uniref:Lipoprotein n=1 Tax=Shinella yambaruensis TaxID=415996 RepID=A0ABQ5ZD31_9HYPH|nr:hypothetical protein [Shinella yambaruensis]MCJ8024439.1 hypothetical protein [Shinella yambaruensis]MCU7980881.1 hypothetical protein [Shinella yambaruensis]GLR49742.1 hypothetical protein GCM10007923_09470 [Shinella yambaruensis]
MGARITGTASAFLLVGMTASAAACTAYEREVYEVAKAVESFRETAHFSEYGWSSKAPYSKWLSRIRQLSDDEEQARKLMISHGFIPMEIYSVADEFRTAGGLDGFYKDRDKDIKSLRCK